MLETLELETAASPEAAVIWLHGLGADGNDFAPVVPQIRWGLPPTRFIFPHAPLRSVTINRGAVMRAWYDVRWGDLEGSSREADEAGLAESVREIGALIAREGTRGIPARRVVLAGFSQGGAVALHAGLDHGERLAGVMGLSTYLPQAAQLLASAAGANRGVSVFLAHGLQDPVIPASVGAAANSLLSAAGYAVEWKEYRMPHSVCATELADINGWLKRVLAPPLN